MYWKTIVRTSVYDPSSCLFVYSLWDIEWRTFRLYRAYISHKRWNQTIMKRKKKKTKKEKKKKERKKEFIKRERDFLHFILSSSSLLPCLFPLFLSLFLSCMIWPLPNPPLIPRSMNNLSEKQSIRSFNFFSLYILSFYLYSTLPLTQHDHRKSVIWLDGSIMFSYILLEISAAIGKMTRRIHVAESPFVIQL